MSEERIYDLVREYPKWKFWKKEKYIKLRIHITPSVEANSVLTFDNQTYIKHFQVPVDTNNVQDIYLRVNVKSK